MRRPLQIYHFKLDAFDIFATFTAFFKILQLESHLAYLGNQKKKLQILLKSENEQKNTNKNALLDRKNQNENGANNCKKINERKQKKRNVENGKRVNVKAKES